MVNIVIIGVGALGKRHLSSILKSNLEKKIYCVDINEYALDDFEEKDDVTLCSSISEIPCEEVDFALFSMSSKGRREMYEALVNHTRVKNIVFEKVLFQTVEDYVRVSNDLKARGICAWVNCARRQMDSYQELKMQLQEAKYMEIHITGGSWGMACNSIHMLDLISFLSQDDKLCIDKMDLDSEIIESKRTGYKEVNGIMEGRGRRVREFSIACIADATFPMEIAILTEQARYRIVESEKKIYIHKHSEKEMEHEFEILYQSQMTKDVLEDIVKHHECRLTPFEESKRLHLMIIQPMIKFFEKNGMEEGKCPIT